MKNNKKHPLTVFREANEARAKLIKKSMGGPGSGMGRMYLDDLAYENTTNSSQTPSSSSAATRASESAAKITNNPNSYNIDAVNSKLIPTFSGSPYARDAMEILERRTKLNNRLREEENRKKASGQKKKGGSVKRK